MGTARKESNGGGVSYRWLRGRVGQGQPMGELWPRIAREGRTLCFNAIFPNIKIFEPYKKNPCGLHLAHEGVFAPLV